jgi:hypothetical protein
MCVVVRFLDGRLRRGCLTIHVCMCSFHPQVAIAEESWSPRCQTLPCLVRAHAKQQIELIIHSRRHAPCNVGQISLLRSLRVQRLACIMHHLLFFWQPNCYRACALTLFAASLLSLRTTPLLARTHTHTHTHTHTNCCLLAWLCCPVCARRQTLSV